MNWNLSKKAKSDLIFWSIALGLVVFLFFTPWGMKVRAWVSSLILGSPDIEESRVVDHQTLGMDWMIVSNEGSEVWISDFDKPIFLNIWATWCGPCRSEMSSIISLREKYKDKVQFLLVSPSEDLNTIKAFVESEGWEFEVYVNGNNMPSSLNFEMFPTTFIINQNKQVVNKFEGAFDWDTDEVYNMLDQLVD